MATPAVDAIFKAANKYGIDPYAMLAIAHHESGLNPAAVGDSGTSFGLFQLHVGGALPKGVSAAQAENPYWNADYTARQLKSLGINQYTGHQAIANISKRFERPADPTSEINDAWNWYAKNATGIAKAQSKVKSNNVTTVKTPQSQAPVPVQLPGGDPLQSGRSSLLGFLLAQNQAYAAGQPTDPNALIGYLTQPQQQAPLTVPTAPVTASKPPKQFPATAPLPTNSVVHTKGGIVEPIASRKVIGRPYQGTHTLYGNWESDNAVDLAAPVGTPIYAVSNGTIGSQFGALGSSASNLAGLRLHLVTKGNEFYYAHMSRFAQGIKPGAKVHAGQLLGYSGAANGVGHLHIASKNGNPLGIFNLS